MSLMKLLSVSNSFQAGKNESGRYKMTEPAVLPKFAPVGRLVSLTPQRNFAVPSPHNGSPQDEPKPQAPVLVADDPGQTLSLRQSCGRHSPFGETTNQAPAIAAAGPRGIACVNAVPASTNWFRLRKNSLAGTPAGKTEPNPLMQGELSLDAVKPVRNDLSDADFEVVAPRPKTRPAATAKRPRPKLFKPELAGLAWSRLTARLFSTDRARV